MRYEVIVAGASFAGLSVAAQLRSRRVLLLDRKPIGTGQTSACATPLATTRAVGAEDAILEVHPALVLHAAGREISFRLEDPYVTFDYRTFCRAMLTHTDAEVLIARATGYRDGTVFTDQGPVHGRYVVDATGWAAALSGGPRSRGVDHPVAYAIETEIPFRPDLSPGLHFYFEKRYANWGYAWAFPCGNATRFGVGSFQGPKGLAPALRQFVDDFGLSVGRTYGGLLAYGFHEPVMGDLFVVGDAAGHCLPLTGEGIRTAIYHGLHCGRAIRGALRGEFSPNEARAFYRDLVLCHQRTYRRLGAAQRGVALLPERWLAIVAQAAARLGLGEWLMNRYLRDTGWFLGHRRGLEPPVRRRSTTVRSSRSALA
ncbi:MAG: NAD(P)/FAD-dependent oxidoreductase [Anaerolineae bacterium]